MISIIVPIYNTEKYLKKCVDSLINQTYGDIEIVLVDDGSSDKSPEICDGFSSADSRIIVIHKKNAGTEKARQTGVEACSGEYIMFLDSDDFLEPEALEIVLKKMLESEADIVTFNLVHKEKNVFDINNECTLGREQALKGILTLNMLDGNLPCKLYKADIVKNKEVHFRDQRNCDILTVIDIVLQSKKIVIIPYAGYHYTFRADSQSHSSKCHPREEEYADGMYDFYKKAKEKYPEVEEEAEYYWLYTLLYVFIHLEKDCNVSRKSGRYISFRKKIKIRKFIRNKYFRSPAAYCKLILCYTGLFRYLFKCYSVLLKTKNRKPS